jgi:hypothetical protein
MDPTKERRQTVKISEKVLRRPRHYKTSVQGRSMNCTRKVQTHRDRKKVRLVKSKVKSMLIILFDIKVIVHKEFVLTDQTVNSAYHCDGLRRLCENVRRLQQELWRQKNWLFHHDDAPSHSSFFTIEFLPKTWLSSPTHPTFLCFPG